MRAMVVLLGSALMGACDRIIENVSGGDVLSDSSHEAIDYRLTSDNYKKWLVAQQALDRAGIRFDERIDVRNVSDGDVDRVTESLQSQPSARAAIEDAGMSVRDFAHDGRSRAVVGCGEWPVSARAGRPRRESRLSARAGGNRRRGPHATRS